MIDQIAFFVRNIGIAVLPDPYIINIIGNVRKTDVNIYLYTGSVFFLNLLVNGYNPWIISLKQRFHIWFGYTQPAIVIFHFDTLNNAIILFQLLPPVPVTQKLPIFTTDCYRYYIGTDIYQILDIFLRMIILMTHSRHDPFQYDPHILCIILNRILYLFTALGTACHCTLLHCIPVNLNKNKRCSHYRNQDDSHYHCNKHTGNRYIPSLVLICFFFTPVHVPSCICSVILQSAF